MACGVRSAGRGGVWVSGGGGEVGSVFCSRSFRSVETMSVKLRNSFAELSMVLYSIEKQRDRQLFLSGVEQLLGPFV